MSTTKRNLAFYKESSEPWTQEEYDNLCEYVGIRKQILSPNNIANKFIFDAGTCYNGWFYPWNMQESNSNFTNCEQLSYESILPTPIAQEVPYSSSCTPAKEITMNQDNITISMTAKEYEKYTEANKPEEPKTDYEARLPFAMVVYGVNGSYESIHYNKTAKDVRKRAKAYLQRPANFGKRITLHQTLDKPLTTAIPIVEIG